MTLEWPLRSQSEFQYERSHLFQCHLAHCTFVVSFIHGVQCQNSRPCSQQHLPISLGVTQCEHCSPFRCYPSHCPYVHMYCYVDVISCYFMPIFLHPNPYYHSLIPFFARVIFFFFPPPTHQIHNPKIIPLSYPNFRVWCIQFQILKKC